MVVVAVSGDISGSEGIVVWHPPLRPPLAGDAPFRPDLFRPSPSTALQATGLKPNARHRISPILLITDSLRLLCLFWFFVGFCSIYSNVVIKTTSFIMVEELSHIITLTPCFQVHLLLRPTSCHRGTHKEVGWGGVPRLGLTYSSSFVRLFRGSVVCVNAWEGSCKPRSYFESHDSLEGASKTHLPQTKTTPRCHYLPSLDFPPESCLGG